MPALVVTYCNLLCHVGLIFLGVLLFSEGKLKSGSVGERRGRNLEERREGKLQWESNICNIKN